MPARYHPVLINLARALTYEMKQDDERALSARTLYAQGLKQAQAHSRPTGGPGSDPAAAGLTWRARFATHRPVG